MLILAHTGITLGAAALMAGAVPYGSSKRGRRFSWFARLGSWLDIRLLLIGSLLPDIIDKPLGQIIFPETLSNGRIFAHTLLFLVLITAAGFYLYRSRGQRWLLALAAGTLTHIIFDEMWRAPAALFWPLMGFGFTRIDLEGWLGSVFQAIIHNPKTYIPELAGLAVLVWFGIWLVRRKQLGDFLRHGRVD